ncbi:hypothetical protein BGZ97_009896 [Linnemannia gamsii]|jgi:hypothetical protein|uniref:Uncharacterized protein n=1 Tax=Linnemannia gamsii TaxID=64522 RepID=A0A9P6UPI2_9FUNG|nr:hypothetical protein BGZ97_009896 [Linnemannia gamsii]
MSDDDIERRYRKLSKDMSVYINQLKNMLEDDLKTYLNAANTQEQEVLREFKEIAGRYFKDLNGSIQDILLAITESMVIFEEGCSHLYAEELEMLDIHQIRLKDAIGRCDKTNGDLAALGTKIGVQISEYEKEKSKFEIVRPDGVSYSMICTLSTGAGVVFQLVTKTNPATAAASLAVVLVGGLVLQYAQTKIENIDYYKDRLAAISNVGLCIREELVTVSKILARLKENISMLSHSVQADKIKLIAWRAKRISAICNEMYDFKSRVGPEFIPLLTTYSVDNCSMAYNIANGARSITQIDA